MGRDKALLMHDGVPFVARIAAVLQAVFAGVMLSANGEEYDFLGLPRVSDLYPGAGPLAGVHAALLRSRREYLFVLPCDVPLVTPAVVRAVCSRAEPGRITVCEDETGLQVLAGVYPGPVAPRMGEYLASGGRKVVGFLEAEGYRRVDMRSRGSVLRNVNTPEELRILSGGA